MEGHRHLEKNHVILIYSNKYTMRIAMGVEKILRTPLGKEKKLAQNFDL